MAPAAHPLWTRTAGTTGAHLVLLHPGGVDSRALDPLVAELEGDYSVVLPEQRGHGHTPDVDGPLSFEAMADDTIAVIEGAAGTAPVHLFGYSDGAIVALHVALRRPDLVRTLVVAAGVFHHDGWAEGVLEGDAPEFLRASYAEVSPDGADHWDVVTEKLRVLHEVAPTLSVADLAAITMPTLVLVGDDDEVRLDHAVAMYEALPDGELAVVPRASHGVVVEHPELVAGFIRALHEPARSPGFAPIRRRLRA